MKTFFKAVILIFLAIIFFVFAFLYFQPQKTPATAIVPAQKNINQVCFSSNCFFVELATTDAQRELGLMNRTSLDKNKGMLFVWTAEGDYAFWMKNTLIPLDMIWMDKNKEVIFSAENVQPCKTVVCPVIDPKKNAKYVLEINGGLSKQLNIKSGDYANFTAK